MISSTALQFPAVTVFTLQLQTHGSGKRFSRANTFDVLVFLAFFFLILLKKVFPLIQLNMKMMFFFLIIFFRKFDSYFYYSTRPLTFVKVEY